MNLMKNNNSIILIQCLALALILSCHQENKSQIVNDKHLNHLYEEILIDDEEMAIIHIYAEYPNYEWVDDADEGTACIDDVARAVIFYIKDYNYNGNESSLNRAQKLIKFILHMQSENGYFYNFIFSDHTINKEHENSINRAVWWSWRALWALTESYPVMEELDTQLSNRILEAAKKLVENTKNEFPRAKEMTVIEGIQLPKWLPYEYASDQAALLIIALTNYYNMTTDKSVIDIVDLLADGIIMMQINNSQSKFHGAFLSWQNHWHGWGNSQSYALLQAYQISKNQQYLDSALMEIDNFYNELFSRKYLNNFSVRIKESEVILNEVEQFSQIAYSFRPMVFAALEAFKISGKEKYIEDAVNYSNWFFGDNHQHEQIYFPETGLCYDGLNETNVNKNSGAESTIESLLLFQELEQNEIAKSYLNKVISKNEQ